MFFKKHSFQLAFTLVAAWASAELFVWLHTPIPWMLGPLIAIAALSMMEAPVTGSAVLRDTAQWVIGGSLGLYFTPDIGRQVVGLWWAIALAAVWALVLGGFLPGGCTGPTNASSPRCRTTPCGPRRFLRRPLAEPLR